MRPLDRTLLSFGYLSAAVAVAPAFLYLQGPVQAALVLAAGLGFSADRRGRELLRPLPATLLALGVFLLYLVQINRDNLVVPVVNLLALFLALRLLTEKTPRHLLQIFVLALFTLAASSLLTLSAAYLVFLAVLLLLVTVGLVLLSCAESGDRSAWRRSELRQVLRWALLLPGGSLLLMLVFFAILPRTQYPLWNFLNPTARPQTGFAEQVRPGTIAALAADASAAFRVEMPRLPADQLYWRGIVLDRLDGNTWSRGPNRPEDLPATGDAGTVEQTIFLEPKTDRFLPLLDSPRQVSGLRSTREGDYSFRAIFRLDRRSRYQALSALEAELRLKNPQAQTPFLQLPGEVSPRLRQLARDITAGATGRREILARFEDWFRQRRLSYASSGLPPTATPVETFLFDTRRGYCEYFAASFGLLLRLSGVPARLVGGYLGGEYNQVGGFYLVTEEMAHVWVEALDENQRWVRIDPSRLAVNAEAGLNASRGKERNWFAQLTDGVEHLWNRTVINYDLQQQIGLARSTGAALRQLRGLSGSKGWLLWGGLAMLPAILLLAARSRARRETRTQRLSGRFRRLALRYGGTAETEPAAGLFELARRIGHPLAVEFAERYAGLLYHDRIPDPAQTRQLSQLLRQLARELARTQ